ncbi:MAG: 4-alpha-glucanotransferase, partial [Chloroflexota bacterium]|nr:4-alpha-glucanotransferase [Chloroflexota bacterium]
MPPPARAVPVGATERRPAYDRPVARETPPDSIVLTNCERSIVPIPNPAGLSPRVTRAARSGRPDPAAWGVELEFTDAAGRRRRPSATAVRRALELMGAGAPAPPPAPIAFVRPGGPTPAGLARVRLEGGGEVAPGRRLPPDLPLGYHGGTTDAGEPLTVVCGPGVCAPPPARAWGWSAQLHSLRSAGGWGIGDLGVLRDLGRWAAGAGAAVVLVNPLHAPLPVTPQQASPY